LKELVTVLAGHVVLARAAQERANAQLRDPAFRAALEAEIEGLKSGRIPSVRADVILRDLDEMLQEATSDQGNGSATTAKKDPML
jgi:hypothetical protein